MALVSNPKDGDNVSVRQAIARLGSSKLGPTSSPTFADITTGGLTLSDLTASRLVWTNASKALASKNLIDLVAGTVNNINVTDDSDGSVTLSLPQDIRIVDGGTIGQTAGPLLTFNDTNNYFGITGCKIGLGTVTPDVNRLCTIVQKDTDALFIKDNDSSISSTLGFGVNTTTGYSYIQSHRIGTGTIQPLQIYVGNSLRLKIGTDGHSDFQSYNIITTGTVNASAGKVRITDNDTTEPTSESDGYIGVAIVGGQPRIYFTVAGDMYYVEGSASAAITTGSSIGLLLCLTYNLE